MDWEYLDDISKTIDDLAKQDSRERLNAIRFMEMMEFEERGGFSQVLKDIFNPSDLSAMELDSVF